MDSPRFRARPMLVIFLQSLVSFAPPYKFRFLRREAPFPNGNGAFIRFGYVDLVRAGRLALLLQQQPHQQVAHAAQGHHYDRFHFSRRSTPKAAAKAGFPPSWRWPGHLSAAEGHLEEDGQSCPGDEGHHRRTQAGQDTLSRERLLPVVDRPAGTPGTGRENTPQGRDQRPRQPGDADTYKRWPS